MCIQTLCFIGNSPASRNSDVREARCGRPWRVLLGRSKDGSKMRGPCGAHEGIQNILGKSDLKRTPNRPRNTWQKNIQVDLEIGNELA